MAAITPPINVPSTGEPVFRYTIFREEHAYNFNNSTLQMDETTVQPADIYCYKILLQNLSPNHFIVSISAEVFIRVTANPLIPSTLLPLQTTNPQNINYIEPWPGGALGAPILSDPGMTNCNVVYFRNLRPFTELNEANGDTKAVSAFAFTTKNMHEGSKFEVSLRFRWRRATEQVCYFLEAEAEELTAPIAELTSAD